MCFSNSGNLSGLLSYADGSLKPYSTKASLRERSPAYIARICGTVIDSDRTKHIVKLLTPDNEVVQCKFYAGAFIRYNSVIKEEQDGKNIVVRGQTNYETGLRKMGAMLGDGADIGCGCVLNPGTVIGKRTSVYPLTSLRGVFPADCIIKSADNIVKRI